MNQIFQILTAMSDFFGGAEEPMSRGLVIMASIVIVLAIALMAWHFTPRRERRQVVNHLAEAIGLGHVGEHIAGEDEDVEPENPAMADSMPEIPRMQPKLREHLPRRQALRWLDNNTVQATTRYRRPFYGEVVGRKRGELILQREKGCPIRVRQPQ